MLSDNLTPYTGAEISAAHQSGDSVAKTESLRQKMTPEQKAEFIKSSDKRCRDAYNVEAQWFMKCIRAKSNSGRDQLYLWISHWLSAYLDNPQNYLKRLGH